MNLVDLQLNTFFTYDAALGKVQALAFPSGTTVFVGKNGSGKTAAGLEATCWLLWGKTTRGVSPDGDIVGGFQVGGTTYAISRERKAKKTTLTLLDTGIGAGPTVDLSGQTATETQAKIDEVFGSWERFTAERVFSNRLAKRFGNATDKERKALVESILGLERHERAAQGCRDELGARKNKLQNIRVKVAAASAAHDEAKNALARVPIAAAGDSALRLRGHVADLEAGSDRAEGVAQAATMRATTAVDRAAKLQRALDQASSAVRALTEQKLRIDGQITKLRERAKASLEMGDCPVCFTPAKDVPKDRMKSHFASELTPLMAERDGIAKKIETAKAEAAEVQGDHAKALEEVKLARATEKTARDDAAASAREWNAAQVSLAAAISAEGEAAKAIAAVERCRLALVAAQAGEEEAEMACLVAEAAVKVLGPRGARVRRMDGALARLTSEANAILARLPVDGTGSLKIKVRGSRALANGKEVDEVSISVTGAGGGEYDGASDGEKVRLDVGIMLGLARLVGVGEGLIVFDELFDPLDDDGLEAIVEVLDEIAATRQVVITTHNPRFLSLLPASACWKVSRALGGPSVIERSA